MSSRGLGLLLAFVLCGHQCLADESGYRTDVLPVLKSHCVDCHGASVQESNLRLDNLSTDMVNDRAAAEQWHAVLNVLKSGEMPPEDEQQLSESQRAKMLDWISTEIDKAIEAGRKTNGRVVLRRLNRLEYQNTMTDLLGLEMDYTRDLPPDSVSPDGFSNDGGSLNMSAIQLEYYLEAARRALDRVIVTGDAPEVFEYEFTETKIDTWLGNAERSNRLGRQQEFLAKMKDKYPEEGDFLVRVALTADLKPETGFPLLEVSVGYQPDTELLLREFDLVEITSNESQSLEFRGRLENFPLPVRGQGKYPGLVVRVRNRYDDGSLRPKPREKKGKLYFYADEPSLPSIAIQSVQFRGPVFDTWPPASHRRILFASELQDSNARNNDTLAYVTEVLRRFMSRAFRRTATDVEVTRMVDLYESIRDDFPSFEESMRETLAMVLIQPEFLYHLEVAGEAKRPVTNQELAARLSYFLWSTMPDDQLTDLADNKSLSDPKTLEAEVARMLDDDRSMTFVRAFTDQWLLLKHVDSVAIDRDYYPNFDDSLKEEMRAETHEFFAELLREDISALNMLSSDFTMLNEPLARHYGIDRVFGRKFRRVELKPDLRRGGVLGHASILLSNSTGTDSHVVRRAVWIRDRLLNDPPSPPPPDTPPLDEADPKFAKLSIRQQLEAHRDRKACASCHRDIDPWGIALENFDAVGLWRNEIKRKVGSKMETIPVAAADELPGGQQLDGAESLRQFLATKRHDQFARSLVTRLLIYALGRPLELSDQSTVDELAARFAENGYRIRSLITRIVASDLFQTK